MGKKLRKKKRNQKRNRNRNKRKHTAQSGNHNERESTVEERHTGHLNNRDATELTLEERHTGHSGNREATESTVEEGQNGHLGNGEAKESILEESHTGHSVNQDLTESTVEEKYTGHSGNRDAPESTVEEKHTGHSGNQDATESIVEGRHDFISCLPEDILYRIISFLPLKSAVGTSILSTRWRNLWNTSIDQDFDEGRILATIQGDKKLHLDFSKGQHWATSHFNWDLELTRFNLNDHPTTNICSLKTLHLRSVSNLTKDIVSAVLSNCQLLESLTLAKCTGLQCLRIDANQKLKSLTVLACPQLKNLHVFAYNLQSFRYRGRLPWFHMKYVPHLVDAMLDFRDGPENHRFSRDNLLSLLLVLTNIKILTLCGWFFEVPISRWLPSAGAIFECEDFRFNNLKELWWIDSSMDKYKMVAMVSFLKICPSLERLFIDIDPMCYYIPSASTWWGSGGRCFWIDYTNRVARYMRLYHLKIVKMMGFTDQKDEILLVDLLLEEVVAMEPMIIATSPENCSRRLVKIPRSQPKQRSKGNANQAAALPHQKMEYHYKFMEEEDGSSLCLTHPHMCL